MLQPHSELDQSSVYRTPRWVKWSAVVTLIAVLLLAIILLTGEHGPGRHMASVGHDSTSAATVIPDHAPAVTHGAGQP